MDYVRYIDRTRAYYLSQGYKEPYRWAHFEDVPFARLKKPLSECTLALVSTSDVALRDENGEIQNADPMLMVGNVYSIPSDTPIDRFYSRQEHYDRYATHLDDVNTYFPITRLHELAAQGKVARIAARAHGVYTAYSHRKTLTADAPEVLKRCREDGVDAVILTPV
jgi:D-proline reductase (dithiol) PrdB